MRELILFKEMQALCVNPMSAATALLHTVESKYAGEAKRPTKHERLLVDELFNVMESFYNANELEIAYDVELIRDYADEDVSTDIAPNVKSDNDLDKVLISLPKHSESTSRVLLRRSAKRLSRNFLSLMKCGRFVEKKNLNGLTLSSIMHNYRKVKCHRDIAVMHRILEEEPRKIGLYSLANALYAWY
jgi:hypothetical protein